MRPTANHALLFGSSFQMFSGVQYQDFYSEVCRSGAIRLFASSPSPELLVIQPLRRENSPSICHGFRSCRISLSGVVQAYVEWLREGEDVSFLFPMFLASPHAWRSRTANHDPEHQEQSCLSNTRVDFTQRLMLKPNTVSLLAKR